LGAEYILFPMISVLPLHPEEHFNMYKVSFNNRNNFFHQDVKSSVDEYFSAGRFGKTGNWKLYIKAMILVPSAVLLYFLLLRIKFSLFPGIMISGLLGFILASIGFNIMHDACHGSYSSKSWVNNLMGLTLNMLGGNAFIWKFKHNIIHHTYTNIDGIDDDIAKSPVIRQCESQKWVKAHRFQHIYVVVLYAISSFAWVSMMDFSKYFRQKIHNTNLQKMDVSEHIIFWVSKLMYITFYIIIPVHFAGWKAWAVGFSCMHIALGLTLAIVFQLAHVVEDAEFVFAPGLEHQKIEEEWAIHQVRTTANFAPNNKLVSWFVGGLNFQIEHHLFPKVSHVHYPAIAHIVREKCEKHQIHYNEFRTMSSAIASHFRMMKYLGSKPFTG
jgi:linoleoyl-CoA desaturase